MDLVPEVEDLVLEEEEDSALEAVMALEAKDQAPEVEVEVEGAMALVAPEEALAPEEDTVLEEAPEEALEGDMALEVALNQVFLAQVKVTVPA